MLHEKCLTWYPLYYSMSKRGQSKKITNPNIWSTHWTLDTFNKKSMCAYLKLDTYPVQDDELVLSLKCVA